MKKEVKELLLQALETELGGVQIYSTAVECAVNDDLKEEWEKYLEQTTHHVEIVRGVLAKLGLDPEEQSAGREVVHHIGESLATAMQTARENGTADEAQLVACECVLLAETKDHANWELLALRAEHAKGDEAKALKAAVEEVEDEEDEHLYHTKGWCRELWIQFLGMKAVLPPPEEEKDVKTAIGAARAAQSRDQML